MQQQKQLQGSFGILNSNSLAITGKELDKIPQNILERDIMKYSVFARVSPDHKVRIVKAFRATRKSSCNDWRSELMMHQL